jgi:hypothetical protein
MMSSADPAFERRKIYGIEPSARDWLRQSLKSSASSEGAHYSVLRFLCEVPPKAYNRTVLLSVNEILQ